MFEIYKRHTPMFAVTEIKRLACMLTDALPFNRANLIECGIEIVDVSQTVRINENNVFIVKSASSPEIVAAAIKTNPTLQRLRDTPGRDALLIADLLKQMAARLAIDAYVCIGNHASLPALDKTLRPAGKGAKKPLMVFNAPEQISYSQIDQKWLGMDHPALWLGNDWITSMEGTEAFFAMSPELKLAVGPNRYQPLERFGDFAVGMVRF